MKRQLVLLASLFAACTNGPGVSTSGVDRKIAVNPDVSLRIWLPSGKVRVAVWDVDTIGVTGTLNPRTHFFGGGSGRGAKVGVENDDSLDTGLAGAELVVTVPRRAHVWIKMTNGSVEVAGTQGELDVITVSGTIDIRDASGVVSVETIDADVSAIHTSGDTRIRGGAGHLRLADIKGSLSASSVSGRLELQGSELTASRLESIGGAITVSGSVAADATVEIETHSGTISLNLDSLRVPALLLSSRSGRVSNELHGGGAKAARIIARSFKGDINVLKLGGIERR